jgi:hypothetical protein
MVAGLATGHWGGELGANFSGARSLNDRLSGEKLKKRKKGAAAKAVPLFIDSFSRYLSENFC